MFLPETEYTNKEIIEILNENRIHNIIYIQLGDVKKGSYGYGTKLSSSSVYYTDIETIELVKIKVEYYNINDTIIKRPNWIIMGEASGGTEFSTTTSVIKKIIGRIIYGLKDQDAF